MSQKKEFRVDLVWRIRQEIANGGYDTDEKLQIALGLMMDEWA